MLYGMNNIRGEWFKQDEAKSVYVMSTIDGYMCTTEKYYALEPHLHTSFYYKPNTT